VVNVGLEAFAEAVREQGGEAVDVDWRPQGGGDHRLVAPLTRLWGRHGDRVEAAHREAVARIEGCRPLAVGVARAGEVVPGLGGRMLLHAGPPIAWERTCGPQRRALIAACVFEGWAADPAGAGAAARRGRDRARVRQRVRPRWAR
jgi:hypothetical protein